MFNFGIPSSFSVYTLFFLTGLVADLVFCCFGGGTLAFFETLAFVVLDFATFLGSLPNLVEDLTVLVGAIFDR